MMMRDPFDPPDDEIADDLIAEAGIYQPYTVADVIRHLSSFDPTDHIYLTIDQDDATEYRVMEIMDYHNEQSDQRGPLLSSWIP